MKLDNQTPVKELQYNDQNGELTVIFQNNKTLAYADVPKDVVNELELSSSMGDFFNTNIKSQYEGKKVSAADQMLLS